MKGTNTLLFNESTMIEIIEYYLKAKAPILIEDSIVNGVAPKSEYGAHIFEVVLKAEED